MNYRQSVRQFADAFSRCALDAEPVPQAQRSAQVPSTNRENKRLYLKASEEAFEEISSNILITILTTKLRKDLRQAGFGPLPVPSEEQI